MLTLDKIYHAAFVLKKVARKTDLIRATKLSKQCELYLKTENLQETGSFKLRGAYYKISQLTEEEKSRGIIACSAGNHAQGVAMAAGHCSVRHQAGHQVHHLHARWCPHQQGGSHKTAGSGSPPGKRRL